MRGLIIGCGNIGALYDSPGSDKILSHAHAFHIHPKIKDYAFVDTNKDQLKKACNLWNRRGFLSLTDALEKFTPKIIALCTPASARLDIVKELTQNGIPFVICEKPLATNFNEASEISNLFLKANTHCNINYSRRFDDSIHALKNSIDKNEFGNLQAVRGVYTKGIMNNGGHLINLFQFILGKFKTGEALGHIIDYSKTDPTLSCFLQFEKCSNVQLVGLDQSNYTIFEYEFLFEKKRICFNESGHNLTSQDVAQDPCFPDYFKLMPPLNSSTSLKNSISLVLEKTLKKEIPVSSSNDAAQTINICEQLLEQFKKERP